VTIEVEVDFVGVAPTGTMGAGAGVVVVSPFDRAGVAGVAPLGITIGAAAVP